MVETCTPAGRLAVDESAHIAAQLPMLIHGIHFEGWDPGRVPEKIDGAECGQETRQRR
jgi:uncharacterized protein (DUF2267 family)